MSQFVNVKGLDELQRFMDQLPAKFERNVARGGLRAGANVVLPVARANVHSVSGRLAKSLKIRTDARAGLVTAKVYTKMFYATFVEYGTKPHIIEPENRKALSFGGRVVHSVHHPGAKAANGGFGFLRNALDTQAGAAVVAMAEYIRTRLAEKHGLDTADIQIAEAP